QTPFLYVFGFGHGGCLSHKLLLLGFYHRLIELIGFALVAGATFWDLHLRNASTSGIRRTAQTGGHIEL
ncbi:MAG TPA: hypothetical protein VHK27_01200, partial [Gammaproteobacteria bacterium]|nr:hypothetical protein [Gammaproteobacteria bacterium]